MIRRVVRFFLGYAVYRFDEKETRQVMNYMMREEIAYEDLRQEGSTRVFTVYRSEKKRLDAHLDQVPGLTCLAEYGLPSILHRYRTRAGILVGAALFCAILALSSKTVWSMDVSGNKTIGDAEILALLEDLQFGIGTFLPEVDFWKLSNRALLSDPRLAFLSVNMEGTHAHVVVMEREEKTQGDLPLPSKEPSHLVASRDGVIVRYEVGAGRAQVKIGQSVRKGEVLISGIVETGTGESYRLERSIGRVYAETVHVFSVRVDRMGEMWAVSERKEIEKKLNFFGFSWKFSKKGGNIPLSYAIISEREQWTLFRGMKWLSPLPLPIFTETVYAEKQTPVRLRKSDDAMIKEAQAALKKAYESESAGMEVLSYEMEKGFDSSGDVYQITVLVRGIEDIALEKPIAFVPDEFP